MSSSLPNSKSSNSQSRIGKVTPKKVQTLSNRTISSEVIFYILLPCKVARRNWFESNEVSSNSTSQKSSSLSSSSSSTSSKVGPNSAYAPDIPAFATQSSELLNNPRFIKRKETTNRPRQTSTSSFKIQKCTTLETANNTDNHDDDDASHAANEVTNGDINGITSPPISPRGPRPEKPPKPANWKTSPNLSLRLGSLKLTDVNHNGSFIKRLPSDASPSGTPHRGILNDSIRLVDRLSYEENVDDILDNMSVHSQTWREYDRSGLGHETKKLWRIISA